MSARGSDVALDLTDVILMKKRRHAQEFTYSSAVSMPYPAKRMNEAVMATAFPLLPALPFVPRQKS